VSRLEIRDLNEPEAVVTYALGATSQVRLAGTVVSHHVLQPGWSWETHAQPEVGTASCELQERRSGRQAGFSRNASVAAGPRAKQKLGHSGIRT
jgi:hypothetical protein